MCKWEEGVAWWVSTLEVRGLTGYTIDTAVFQRCVLSLFISQSTLLCNGVPICTKKLSIPYPRIEVEDESSREPCSQRQRNPPS